MPGMRIQREVLHFLKTRMWIWVTTIVLLLAVFLGFVYLTEGTAVLPFVYSLF